MNIISNDCTGGFIYRDIIKEEYANPFIFSKVLLDDFIYLASNYQSINFRKFGLLQSAEWQFYIRVNDKINIQYNHYKFDPTVNGIRKDPPNVYSSHIWEYIVGRYITRVHRMNEPPIFVGHYDYGQLGEWDPTLTIEKLNSFIHDLQVRNQLALIVSELPIDLDDTDSVKILRFKRVKIDDEHYEPVIDLLSDKIHHSLAILSKRLKNE